MNETIAIVCFQWNTGFRDYQPEYVNVLQRMVARNLSLEHRFICITDEYQGFSADVEILPVPKSAREIAKLQSPEGSRFPASYRRLWLFSNEATMLADRVMLLDIDCIVCGWLDPFFESSQDFVGWRPISGRWSREDRVGGGTWLLRTGTHTRVWEDFIADPLAAMKKARKAGYRGSDQAWISYCLAEDCAVWTDEMGIYRSGIYQNQDGMKKWQWPPEDARIVHFNGVQKPWSPSMQKKQWIREYWQ